MRTELLAAIVLGGALASSGLGGCSTPRRVGGEPVLAAPDANIETAPSAPSASASTSPTEPTPSAPSSVPSAEPVTTAEPDPRTSPDAQRAADAVMALPGVQGLCVEAKARGASSCSAWPSQAPTEPCASTAVTYTNEACWWGVALEEVMTYPDGTGHGNRVATFWVEPGSFTVKAANDFACADMLFTLPAYRAMKVRASKSGAPDCDGAVPYPTAPP